MKVAINVCYGGFGLSKIAEIMLLRKKGYKELFFYKTILNSNYQEIGYSKITEKDFINNGETCLTTIVKKDFGNYLKSPCLCIREKEKEQDSFNDEKQDIFDDFYDSTIYCRIYTEDRTDKDLIDVIECLGIEGASGEYAKLKIIDIPDDIDYEIDSYDGQESIHEKHRVWE